MLIKYLKLKNFGLFKEAEINPQHINLVKGVNLDNPKESSNGSGKSSLFKNALLFVLYGEGCGKLLNRLISFGEKECSVESELYHKGEHYKIIRKIPNKLSIFIDGTEKEFNTPTIAQTYLNSVFGDYSFFRKFCLIDNKGINLLDSLDDSRSIVSFKKELMQFIDTEFAPIRESLLTKKNEREIYNVDKRLYHFYLSTKRLTILNNGLINLETERDNVIKDKETQNDLVNELKIKIQTTEVDIENLRKQEKNNLQSITKNKEIINNYNNKIDELLRKPTIIKIDIIDYDSQIIEKEKEIKEIEDNLKAANKFIESLNEKKERFNLKINSLDGDLKKSVMEVLKIEKEIQNLEDVQVGTKCDRCGSFVTDEHKNDYKKEKILSINNIEISQKTLEAELLQINEEIEIIIQKITNVSGNKTELENILIEIREEIKLLNTKKFEQSEKVRLIEKEKDLKESEIKKYKELIITYETQINEYNTEIETTPKKIEQSYQEIEKIKEQLITEESCMKYYNELYESIQNHVGKTKENLMKLKEAQKFSAYKYTKEDVQLYTDSIKTLDLFSGYYISEWINNLSFIINDLLKNINLSVELTEEKEFIKIKGGKQELIWNDLSEGQKKFFSAIFKLAILLHKGDSDKIIICDDGMGEMDDINFENFIEICQTLPMQFFMAYQDPPQVDNVNYINIIREKGVSKIK